MSETTTSRDVSSGEELGTGEELRMVGVLPPKAVLASLGCGNPTALADLHPGEVVLDLGSGWGRRRGARDAHEVRGEYVVPIDRRELGAVDHHVVAGRLERCADDGQAQTGG